MGGVPEGGTLSWGRGLLTGDELRAGEPSKHPFLAVETRILYEKSPGFQGEPPDGGLRTPPGGVVPGSSR